MAGTKLQNNFIIYEGKTQEFKFVPNTNNKIKSVKINNINMGAISYYKLTPSAKNYTIEVEFEPITYTIDLNLNQSVQLLTSTDLENVVAGSTVEFKVNVEEGYEIDKVLVNGKEQTLDGDILKIKNIQANTTIDVVLKETDKKIDKNFIIAVSVIGAGIIVLIGLGFAITKRKRPY